MDELEAFYREHYQRLLRVIMFLAAGDVDLAKEAMDEAITVACRRWESIENPPAYVRKVAAHWLIKKKQEARWTIPVPPDETGEKPNYTHRTVDLGAADLGARAAGAAPARPT